MKRLLKQYRVESEETLIVALRLLRRQLLAEYVYEEDRKNKVHLAKIQQKILRISRSLFKLTGNNIYLWIKPEL